MLASLQISAEVSVESLIVSKEEATGTQTAEQGRKSATFQEQKEEISLVPNWHYGIMGEKNVALELERSCSELHL